MNETVDIVRLGHAGDGVTETGVFVPFTVPKDVVLIAEQAGRGRLLEVIRPSPDRVDARCAHFGRCGGCALQMLAPPSYLAWKRDLVITALRQRGFENPAVEAIRSVKAGTRRRATFKARASAQGLALGFHEAGSHALVDVARCPVLLPSLERLIAPAKDALRLLLRPGEMAELHVTATDSGPDLMLNLKRPRSLDLVMFLSEMASTLKLARLSWNGEAIVAPIAPMIEIGRFQVRLPPRAFLQPTKDGERMLQALAAEHAGSCARIADLFSGCGTFGLALADGRDLFAADASEAQIAALAAAARAGQARVRVQTRDLFRRPLLAIELEPFDAVILDPPRAGAHAQCTAIAGSSVRQVLYVSCNPATFARDARILVGGGYELERVVPLDQFLWSAHVELFASFRRAS